MIACAARDVCEGICYRKILHFSYCCKYGVLVFGDDGTAHADESKRTKRVQGCSHQIMGGGFYSLQYYCFVKQPRLSFERAYKECFGKQLFIPKKRSKSQ